ncbi:MAG: class I SAM-dependent methyltransferase [Phycisphaerales bacterium]|nr:class I SAM-dependent methyltransferase [Phycisphaerales bacterium]
MANTKSKKKGSKRRQKKKAGKGWMTAETADRHDLYERSVQNTESEIDFVDQTWMELRGRHATSLREDFCGTAQSSVEWVTRRPDNVATGVDLDEEVVAWGRDRTEGRLDEEQQSRLEIIIDDVRTAEVPPVDTVLAMNFSYYLFKTREGLRGYFSRVHEGLVDDGLFILDSYGGSESFEEMEEERDLDGFTYVWDQHHYNPISGDVINKIHFKFPDGTEIENAFTYEWRLWTLPELQELLLESGFSNVTIYWEGTEEESEEGDGVFVPTTTGEACAGWIAYIVAEK